LAALRPGDEVWVLDAQGELLDSTGLARRLSDLELRGVKRLVLLLGGAHGLDESALRRGPRLSLSRLTFPHELCRAVVLEQLYRARTIQRGEPYHH
jgi:23S rRNA (pseudouridine1915-N3)-methyltransferase